MACASGSLGRGFEIRVLVDLLADAGSARSLLSCVPEPPAEAKAQAVAKAKERYDRLLKSASRAMVGESKLALQDLVASIEE
jgi:hypothetical protein